MVGEFGNGPVRVTSPCRGEGTAAWRRREGARCRLENLGEGRAMGGSVGLSAGEDVYAARSWTGATPVSISKWTGCRERCDAKPLLAA